MDYRRLEQIDKNIDHLEKIKSLINQRYKTCESSAFGDTFDKLECSIKFTLNHQSDVLFRVNYDTHYEIQDVVYDTLVDAIYKEAEGLRKEKASILGVGKSFWQRMFK